MVSRGAIETPITWGPLTFPGLKFAYTNVGDLSARNITYGVGLETSPHALSPDEEDNFLASAQRVMLERWPTRTLMHQTAPRIGAFSVPTIKVPVTKEFADGKYYIYIAIILAYDDEYLAPYIRRVTETCVIYSIALNHSIPCINHNNSIYTEKIRYLRD
jgi:hypothetical protein